MVRDAENVELDVGSQVAFYYADARVMRGTVVKITQTVWERQSQRASGTLFIELEPGGTKYKRRADAVIKLTP